MKIYPTLISKNTLTVIFIEQNYNIAEGQIFDSVGKICAQFSLEKGNNQVELELESGVYFLKIDLENKQIWVY